MDAFDNLLQQIKKEYPQINLSEDSYLKLKKFAMNNQHLTRSDITEIALKESTNE